MRLSSRGGSLGLPVAILLNIAVANPMVDIHRDNGLRAVRRPQAAAEPTVSATAIGPRSTSIGNEFEWAAVGDSWTSGVAYSASTVYSDTDYEYCYRTTEAWGAKMEADTTWTTKPQKFHFAGCGGTLMADIDRQMNLTGNSQLIVSTLGGNNGLFGDIARACIYQPGPGSWGPPYDEDKDNSGDCKKNLARSRTYIDAAVRGLREEFTGAIDSIIDFKLKDGQVRARFDVYVSSYVQFFDATTDDCSGWTFARWFSTGYPKLVKPLRAEMNELVAKFNDVQADVIRNYPGRPGHEYYVHYIPISDQFQGHRFCEKGHSFDDQYTSKDVWIWNLQWNDGDTGGTGKPAGAPDGPLPVMSLDTLDRNDQDNLVFTDPNARRQSGFGWTARPFHPKPIGHETMKNFYIQRFKDDKIPGIVGVDQLPPPVSSAPAPAPSVYCTNPSLEDGDGLCTCNVGTFTFTTFTPGGGPGNSCQVSTVVPPSPPGRQAIHTTMVR